MRKPSFREANHLAQDHALGRPVVIPSWLTPKPLSSLIYNWWKLGEELLRCPICYFREHSHWSWKREPFLGMEQVEQSKWKHRVNSQAAQTVKILPASAGDIGDPGLNPGSGRSLKEKTATHSSISSGKIPWRGEPGGSQSMVAKSQTLPSNWACACTYESVTN